MLQQESSGQAVAFDEKLGDLNMEWHTVIQDVEEKKKSIEKTAKKWWDFTRNKLKMIRWLKKKEGDADLQNATSCRIDSAQDQLTAYQVSFFVPLHLLVIKMWSERRSRVGHYNFPYYKFEAI